MQRFVFFVDGSNLFGSFKGMGDDYESFYRFIFEKALDVWRTAIIGPIACLAQLFRVYWYELGSIDDWNLADPKAQAHLRERFEQNKAVKRAYMALAGPRKPGAALEEVATEAWAMCFNEFKTWYDQKKAILTGMKSFHYGLQTSSNFIDVIESGHWKVDFLHRVLTEKNIDTTLAVDMIAMELNYDVALIVSGDADSIPSINYMKARGKHIGAVEFLSGYPPEKRGKNFSTKLKGAADFVVQIYEMDLVSKGIARKDQPSLSAQP